VRHKENQRGPNVSRNMIRSRDTQRDIQRVAAIKPVHRSD